jgi:putative oxidoreductase
MNDTTMNSLRRERNVGSPAYTARSATAMNAEDAGKLLLRLLIGMLILVHGFAKIEGGVGQVMQAVTKAGLPGAFAYLAYVGEVLAPLLLIIGAWTRPAAVVVAINMIFAIALVHIPQILKLSQTGGWAIELQALYLFGAIAIALLGAGRYSLSGIGGRWN